MKKIGGGENGGGVKILEFGGWRKWGWRKSFRFSLGGESGENGGMTKIMEIFL